MAYLTSSSAFSKLMLLFGLILVFSILSGLSGLLIGKLYFDTSLTELSGIIANPQNAEAINFMKFFQLINQLGIFILPVLVYSFFVSNSPGAYLKMGKKPSAASLLIAGLVVYSVLPFLNYLADINQQVVLPEIFSGIERWMKDKEYQATRLTEMLLKTDNPGGLSLNLLVVAVVPALGEELLFRGVLLRLMKELTKSLHLAVMISAFLFSAVHLQFYGFLPRFLLGLILGYSFVFSQNLWVPVFLHFINNASSVIIYYLHYNGYIKISMESFGTTPNPVYIVGSLLATLWLMMMLYQKEGRFVV
ncbi:MAG: CPBP family intramembrane metalloprotease [Bacteroidales bacterium]|nr:CPBP family intramembrane metalloprotease [Bacteroidales bacterium]